MRIAFFGTPDFAVPCLEAVVRAGHDVAVVVSQPDKPKGRGQAVEPSPVTRAAERLGLTVAQPASLRNPPFAPVLAAKMVDVAVVVAYGKILPPDLLAVPPRGCVNVHASLLPRWRGAAPIQWAIVAGDRTTGVTTMKMDKGMDTGDLLLSKEVEIGPSETGGTLFGKLSRLGADLLVETLEGLRDGRVRPTPQDSSRATHARMLTKEDGRVDWSRPAAEIERRVRGLHPWPGAFTGAAGKTLKLHRVEVGTGDDGLRAPAGGAVPGSVLGVAGDALAVAAGDGVLSLVEVQPEGGRRMSGAEFARGRGAGVARLGDA